MPDDLKVSQIGSSPLPPPFRGLHSPGVKKKKLSNYLRLLFRKSSIIGGACVLAWGFVLIKVRSTINVHDCYYYSFILLHCAPVSEGAACQPG